MLQKYVIEKFIVFNHVYLLFRQKDEPNSQIIPGQPPQRPLGYR